MKSASLVPQKHILCILPPAQGSLVELKLRSKDLHSAFVLLQDDLIPAEKKGHFLQSGGAELQRALDFQICSKSDVFVPAISGLFYGNVAGKRITLGRTQILVPSQVPSSSSTSSNFFSPYVSKKNHVAYSCFC